MELASQPPRATAGTLLLRVATALLAGGGLWWLLTMSAPALSRERWPVVAPPGLVHALVMNLGVLPLFLAGHVLLANPARQGARGLRERWLAGWIGLEVAGWCALLWGAHHSAAWASGGLGAVALARSGLAVYAWRLAARKAALEATHPWLAAASFTIGALAAWLAAAGMAGQVLELIYAALGVSTWWFVAALCAAVLHQLASQVAGRPQRAALLAAWVGTMAIQVPFTLALASGAWAGWGAALLDLCVAAVLFALCARLLLATGRPTMLAWTVALGHAWCGAALLLQAASIALMNLTPSGTDLGLAPLHALTMGCFGSTVMAVALNASPARGPAGRTPDAYSSLLLVAAQLAVATRLAAEWWWAASSLLLPAAMIVWLAAMLLWLWPHARGAEATRRAPPGRVT